MLTSCGLGVMFLNFFISLERRFCGRWFALKEMNNTDGTADLALNTSFSSKCDKNK